MEVIKVVQLTENLWALDEIQKTTMFVIKGSERALLIDTGFGLSDLPAVVGGLCGDLPVLVVNTHAHVDHNGGNNRFDCVMVGRFDEPASHWELGDADRLRCITGFFGPLLTEGYDLSGWRPGPCGRVEPLADGDYIDLGDIRLQVLESPGHTAGCICLFEPDLGWLFTGDLVLTWEVWGQLSRSPFGSSVCLRYYSHTLDRLEALAPKVRDVFPAHGKDDNPPGYTHYRMPPEVLGIYACGTRNIVNGSAKGDPYQSLGGPGLCVPFQVGGMVYHPERI